MQIYIVLQFRSTPSSLDFLLYIKVICVSYFADNRKDHGTLLLYSEPADVPNITFAPSKKNEDNFRHSTEHQHNISVKVVNRSQGSLLLSSTSSKATDANLQKV